LEIITTKNVGTPKERAGQRDGRHPQADDDFGGWVKTAVLFLAVSEP